MFAARLVLGAVCWRWFTACPSSGRCWAPQQGCAGRRCRLALCLCCSGLAGPATHGNVTCQHRAEIQRFQCGSTAWDTFTMHLHRGPVALTLSRLVCIWGGSCPASAQQVRSQLCTEQTDLSAKPKHTQLQTDPRAPEPRPISFHISSTQCFFNSHWTDWRTKCR